MKKRIELREFIKSVKEELLEYQDSEEGEDALFQIEEVVLEVALGTTLDKGGKVNLYAVELGAKASREYAHKITMKLSVVESNPLKPNAGSTRTKAKVKKGTGNLADKPTSATVARRVKVKKGSRKLR